MVHYAVMRVCQSFIPACTYEWSYDCGLFGADYTEDRSKVTCGPCLKEMAIQDEYNKQKEYFLDDWPSTKHFEKLMDDASRRLTAVKRRKHVKEMK